MGTELIISRWIYVNCHFAEYELTLPQKAEKH